MSKKKINKSQEIRDYVTANPESSAKEVVAALAKKKIGVTAATVATVKFKAGLSKKRGGTKAKRRGRPPSNGRSSLDLDALLAAKKFAAKAGSLDQAIESLKVLQKLEAV